MYCVYIYISIELWPLAATNEIVTPASKVKHVSCMRLEAYKPVITGKGYDYNYDFSKLVYNPFIGMHVQIIKIPMTRSG